MGDLLDNLIKTQSENLRAVYNPDTKVLSIFNTTSSRIDHDDTIIMFNSDEYQERESGCVVTHIKMKEDNHE